MSDVVLFGRDLAMRTKTHVERTPVASPLRNKNRIGVAADLFSPVVLVGGWEKIIENGGENGDENSAESGWVARCRRLWQDATTGKYDPADWNPEVSELYDPTADGKPASLPGDRVWAVYRGRWEVVSSPAPASASALYGTIMVEVPPNEDGSVEVPRLGRVALDGKKYPEDDNGYKDYDRIGCKELAFYSDEYLLEGDRSFKITGPYKCDASFVKTTEKTDNGDGTMTVVTTLVTTTEYEAGPTTTKNTMTAPLAGDMGTTTDSYDGQVDYYIAVESAGIYGAYLTTRLDYKGTATIDLIFINKSLTVRAPKLGPDEFFMVGAGVQIVRQNIVNPDPELYPNAGAIIPFLVVDESGCPEFAEDDEEQP